MADNRSVLQGSREAFLNVVRRCGPIVEIIDDSIYFVHFSAKEYVLNHPVCYIEMLLTTYRYLLSTESGKYLNDSQSNMNVATTCLKYLRSECFDPELIDEDVKSGILRGGYVLQDYAVSYWIEHVMRASSYGLSTQLTEQLSREIEETLTLRANSAFEEKRTAFITPSSLTLFEKPSSKTPSTLVQIWSFLLKRRRELSISEGKNAVPTQSYVR